MYSDGSAMAVPRGANALRLGTDYVNDEDQKIRVSESVLTVTSRFGHWLT